MLESPHLHGGHEDLVIELALLCCYYFHKRLHSCTRKIPKGNHMQNSLQWHAVDVEKEQPSSPLTVRDDLFAPSWFWITQAFVWSVVQLCSEWNYKLGSYEGSYLCQKIASPALLWAAFICSLCHCPLALNSLARALLPERYACLAWFNHTKLSDLFLLPKNTLWAGNLKRTKTSILKHLYLVIQHSQSVHSVWKGFMQ